MLRSLRVCCSLGPVLLAANLALAQPAGPESLVRAQVAVRLKSGAQVEGVLSFVGASLMIVRTDAGGVVQIPREDVVEVRARSTPPPPSAATVLASTSSVVLGSTELALQAKSKLPNGLVFGFQFAGLVAGTVGVSDGRRSESGSAGTGGGFGLAFEMRVNDNFSIGPGLQAAYLQAVMGADIDLVLRMRFGGLVGEYAYPYLAVSPGVAILVPGTTAGFSVSFGAGVALGSKRAAVTFEVGYRLTLVSHGSVSGYIGFVTPQVGFQTSF